VAASEAEHHGQRKANGNYQLKAANATIFMASANNENNTMAAIEMTL